ncbi:hypothetical protein ES708_04878 [subsurface metagenome]
MGDLQEEKIALILKKDKLEEERAKLGKADLEENERIKKEIEEIHAQIEKINKKLRDTLLGVE